MPVSFENRNFQKELDKKLELIKKEEKVPTLLLHSCCAPCSSYVIEYLSRYFQITVFYYNPNISAEEEYRPHKSGSDRNAGNGHELHLCIGDLPFCRNENTDPDTVCMRSVYKTFLKRPCQ